VEAELKQGRTVLVLFWDPKGTDDVAVRRELHALQALHGKSGLPQNRRLALHEAGPGEVGSFGSFTRAVQVYVTPTILIILPSGKTKTLTGLTDDLFALVSLVFAGAGRNHGERTPSPASRRRRGAPARR